MSRVTDVFRAGHKALIGYLTVGYPSLEATLKAGKVLAGAGCDLLELGIPFSDPLADGATIQRASFAALGNGVTTRDSLQVAARLSQEVTMPLVFMSYYNPLIAFGLDRFCQSAVGSGVSGLIIPDLPPEEGEELEVCTRKHGLDLIYLLTPASTDERISLVSERSTGFIYLVSLTGVTGARQTLSGGLEDFVRRVRAMTAKPLAVGFGIASPEQAERVARVADGVIVGSRLVQLIEEDETLARLGDFAVSLRGALDRGSDGGIT